MKTVFLVVALIPLLLKTCLSPDEASDRVRLAEVGGESIYLDEALNGMPDGLSSQDSTNYVQEYLNSRINDILVYQMAVRNIPESKEMEQMVENYRRSLMRYEYQQRVLNERFKAEVNEDELKQYYEAHKNRFTADKDLVKGIFLKVPTNAPNISGLKKWLSEPDTRNMQQIERYSVQYASVFNYFMEQWTPLTDIVGSVPDLAAKGPDLTKGGRTVEVTDESFTYLLYVSEGVAKGETAPFDYAKPMVVNVMLNARKTAFIKQFETDLKNKAAEDGRLTLYNKPT
jgi:hypothetical protein